MSILVIEKYNNSYFKIICTLEQSLELYSFFQCYTKNFYFHPKFKAKLWNGKISFFDIHNGNLLPIGLLYKLKEFLIKFKYQVLFNFDKTLLFNDISEYEIKKFYKAIFNESKFYPRDYQHKCIYEAIKRKTGVIESATGCHQKGTKILLSNGSLKNVEDIKIGDILMGLNNQYKKVLKIISGNEKMYKITPKKGNSFIVNKNHILHLKFTNGENKKKYKKEYINISVNDYLKQNKTFKYETKLIFNNKELIFNNKYINNTKLTPYFIGLYLGYGHVYNCSITTMDNEIIDVIYKTSKLYNTNITKKDNNSKAKSYNFTGFKGSYNPIIEDFHKLGLHFGMSKKYKRCSCETKFIPNEIKYGSVKDRYEVIAGLIDSNGNLNKSYYEFCVKSKKLHDDFVFICRSLGFFVTCKERIINNRVYYRCIVQGDIEKIPCKVKRKKIKKINRNKNIFIHGFDIEYIGNDNFYGFSLDGDKLYFTSDFCIHHNSGKSLIIYSLIRFILGMVNKNILIIVPNISLTNQLFNDCNEYGWLGYKDYISVLYGNSKNYNKDKRILISTWQSIYKKKQKFFEQFGAVIVDETHIVSSNSLQIILKKCINAEYRIGLTGTLPTEDIDIYTIFGYLGPTMVSIKSKELIKKGYLSNILIANLLLKYPNDEIQKNKKRTYPEEYRAIIENEDRNKIFNYIIKNINTNDNILILCERIDHLKSIFNYINDIYNKTNRKIFLIHGNIDVKKRENIRKFTENNNGVIIIATYGTMSIGINIKKLHHIIAASSYKSKIKVLQSIGRGLRLHETKDKMIWWDIIDDMRWKKRKHKNQKDNIGYNYMFEQFLARKNYYKEQGFKCLNKEVVLSKL